MRFNIRINQKAISELSPGISFEEAAILDYLIGLCESGDQKIQKNRKDGFTWVNYPSLILNMPLLRAKSPAQLTSKIKRLEEAGYIRTKILCSSMKKRKYIKLTDLCHFLYSRKGFPVNSNVYNNLKRIGMKDLQAKIMASDPEFIEKKWDDLVKNVNKRNDPQTEFQRNEYEPLKNTAGFLWSAYIQWQQIGV